MHIVHIYDGHERVYNGRGSVPNVVWNIARETAAAGHQVTVIERQWQGLSTVAEHENVHFERLDLWTGAEQPWERVPYEMVKSPLELTKLIVDRVNFARSALSKLRAIDFDILHIHLPFAANVLMTVAPKLRRQMVYTAHLGELRLNALTDEQSSDDDQFSVPRILSILSPDVYLARRAARTTVLNPDIQSVFQERGVSPSALTVVPNGVDIERFGAVDPEFTQEVQSSYGLGNKPMVLFVGTVMPRKGVDTLIRAVDVLVHEYGVTDAQLVIAGEDDLDGKYVARIHELVREAGLEEQVCIPGFVPDRELPALYDAADVFVMPSLEEGFGMTVTEAMAAGTPVVASRVGGIPQQVTHGEQGLLIEPNAPNELSSQLAHMLSDADERERIGDRAREYAKEFSWQWIGQNFESVYQDVIQ